MAATLFGAGEDITHDTAKAVLRSGLEKIGSGATQVDCGALTRFDSSALAVLLAWRRAAAERGQPLDVLRVPEALASLARAYGIDTLAIPELSPAVG